MSESNGIDTGSLPNDKKEREEEAKEARQIANKDKAARDDESDKADPASHGSGLPPMSDGSAGGASNGPATPDHNADVAKDAPTAPNVTKKDSQKENIDKKSDDEDSSRRQG
ncbi:hypothetical protein [Halomonas sp. PR-M31]|uniref:hypothetical protein n=1 Tax=Halomonas sp. PR-M31 TaxID=1471202 RepID=UPI0006504F91|nr:hypothetical protein [Halomonas sp. PR-M31]